MRERFTEAARSLMQAADREATRLHHEYICPEHLLSVMIEQKDGVACQAFRSVGIDLADLRMALDNWALVAPKSSAVPRLNKTVEYAIEEARQLHHIYVGTEHLLLGLLRDRDATLSNMLAQLEVNIESLRAAILVRIPPGNPDDIARREALEAKLQNHPLVLDLKKKIDALQEEMRNLVRKGEFREASSYSRQRRAMEDKLEELYASFETRERGSA